MNKITAGMLLTMVVVASGVMFLFPVRSANAMLRFTGHKQEEPAWITKALENGELDHNTVELMRRRVFCQPDACAAAWGRAVDWLKRNSLSIETMPDMTYDVLQFKSAMGNLAKYPEVEIVIQMETWKSEALNPEITIEHFGHDGNGREPEQLVQDAKTFADFKNYMLNVPGTTPIEDK